MKINPKTILTLFAVTTTSILLNACNTTAGLGRDMRKLGDKIEDKAIENKHY